MARIVKKAIPLPIGKQELPADIADVFLTCPGHCLPKLEAIQDGHAIFTSTFPYDTSKDTRAGDKTYKVTCKVPLTDPIFTSKNKVFYLYARQALPFAIFSN